MRRAIERAPRGSWPGHAEASVTLGYDDRFRRRIRLTTDQGEDFLLDLPDAAVLADGDGLRLEDGTYIAVRAADEDVVAVTCREASDLPRVAWHIGNRHIPAAFERARILIRADHVIEDMVRGLGAEATPLRAPFTPEGGAYARQPGHSHERGHDRGGHSHEPGHGHDHSHEHDHDHSHEHDHDHSHEPGHDHGRG